MARDFDERLPHGGLVIGNSSLGAVLLDDEACCLEVAPGYLREQVVLDLVVEAAVPDVNPRAGHDIPAGQDMAVEEVDVAVGVRDVHSLVVRGKDAAHVQAGDQVVHQHEEACLPPGQREQQDASVDTEMERHAHGFDGAVARFAAYEIDDAYDVYANALQGQHREEVVRLVASQPAHERRPAASLTLREVDDVELGVGV